MNMFIWKESFNTGVEKIDSQHKLFLDYLNECNEYVFSYKKTGVIPEVIAKMKAYADMHFAFEEELMRSVNYADINQHEAQHKLFEHQVEELEDAISKGINDKAISLAAFMRDWLINHILEEDKKYTQYLTQQN
jgi:hemerythrin-like metal-binding protein